MTRDRQSPSPKPLHNRDTNQRGSPSSLRHKTAVSIRFLAVSKSYFLIIFHSSSIIFLLYLILIIMLYFFYYIQPINSVTEEMIELQPRNEKSVAPPHQSTTLSNSAQQSTTSTKPQHESKTSSNPAHESIIGTNYNNN